MTMPAPRRRRRTGRRRRRRERETEIIAATRALFDARGVRDAQIEDIARAVGINRAIIYRHFTGKEELFALTLAGYLEELRAALAAADDATPTRRAVRRITGRSSTSASSTPRSSTAAMTILRMGPALLEELSSSALSRLGGMTDCLARVVEVIRPARRPKVLRRGVPGPGRQHSLRARARRAPARPAGVWSRRAPQGSLASPGSTRLSSRSTW